MKGLLNFIQDEEGINFAEYAILLGIITIAIASVITALGDKFGTSVTNATDVFN